MSFPPHVDAEFQYEGAVYWRLRTNIDETCGMHARCVACVANGNYRKCFSLPRCDSAIFINANQQSYDEALTKLVIRQLTGETS